MCCHVDRRINYIFAVYRCAKWLNGDYVPCKPWMFFHTQILAFWDGSGWHHKYSRIIFIRHSIGMVPEVFWDGTILANDYFGGITPIGGIWGELSTKKLNRIHELRSTSRRVIMCLLDYMGKITGTIGHMITINLQ